MQVSERKNDDDSYVMMMFMMMIIIYLLYLSVQVKENNQFQVAGVMG